MNIVVLKGCDVMTKIAMISLILLLFTSITAFAETQEPIRDYLIQNGYATEQITYDTARHMVQMDGRDFYGTWPKDDGRAYGVKEFLDNLIAKHQAGDYMVVMDAPKMMIK